MSEKTGCQIIQSKNIRNRHSAKKKYKNGRIMKINVGLHRETDYTGEGLIRFHPNQLCIRELEIRNVYEYVYVYNSYMYTYTFFVFYLLRFSQLVK